MNIYGVRGYNTSVGGSLSAGHHLSEQRGRLPQWLLVDPGHSCLTSVLTVEAGDTYLLPGRKGRMIC